MKTSIRLFSPSFLLLLGMGLVSTSRSAPNDPIAHPKAVVDAAFASALAVSDPKVENLQKALLFEWFIQTYQVSPLFGPVRMEEKYQAVQTEFQKKNGFAIGAAPRGGSEDTYWSLAGLLSTFAWGEVGLGLTAADSVRSWAQEPIARADSFLRMSELLRWKDSDLTAKAEKLDQMRKANAVLDVAVERVLGLPRGQSAKTLYQSASFPKNSVTDSIAARINGQDVLVISRDELKALFVDVIAQQGALGDEILTTVQQLVANQQDLLGYMSDAQRRAINQQIIAAHAEEWQKQVDAANASIYILSALVGFTDPKLANDMRVVGGSTVQVVDSLRKFAAADALTSVALTGNMVGAVLNVVSLFSNSGPSPDQQILAAIAQLQQMVHQLRVEMHERFDRVDAALNQIYTTMNERFDRIDIVLGILNGDVQEIQSSLYNLQSDLHRMESKLLAFLDAIGRRDFNETLSGYLGYRATYGVPIPQSSFIFAENKFYSWAVTHARDGELSGYLGRGCGDASLLTELTSQPLERNLNFLSEYINRKFAGQGVQPFTTVVLANPREWAIGANAWMELAAESPLFFRQLNSNRFEQIYAVGLDIQRAVAKITLLQTNPTPFANRGLANALFANYRAKAAVFKQRMSEKEEEYRLSLSADARKREPLRGSTSGEGRINPHPFGVKSPQQFPVRVAKTIA